MSCPAFEVVYKRHITLGYAFIVLALVYSSARLVCEWLL